MSGAHKKFEDNEQRKKPVALAVSFVLLFICMMVVVILAAKNIGYKQQIQIDTGEQIVKHYKELDRKLAYMRENLFVLEEKASKWDEAAQQSSTFSQYLLEDINSHISALLNIGEEIKPKEIDQTSQQQLASWHRSQQQLLELLAQSDRMVNKDYLNLKVLTEQLDQLKSAVAGFNFKMEGNRSAMIRLSSGFDWMEPLQQITMIVKVD